ncbi:MAG TPA: toll/interleukin-1 receptor domain-containing protein [Allosphingosinicella sp.]|nr:toll/interleukin-1 receptor domain-containing protein [Allosphingosinicella sp.]
MAADDYKYDVFISHAHEDKQTVARPLSELLERAGMAVWYDETTLAAGMSLSSAIDQGLASSRFGVVVLSKHFFEKNWPKHELAGLRARQMNGQNVIIPIWADVEFEDVLAFSPPLADMLALRSPPDTIEALAEEIVRIVNPESNSRWLSNVADAVANGIETAPHLGPEFDYWPEGGLRNLYHRLLNFASHRQFQRYFGGPIWLSGPHGMDGLDLHNPTEFGHYNPDFVEWLFRNLRSILGKPLFVKLSKGLFTSRFQEIGLLYYASYEYLRRNPHVSDALRQALIVPSETGLPANHYRDLSWTKDVDDGSAVMELMRRLDRLFDSNRAAAAVAFWTRRMEDGTASIFAKIVVLLLKTYETATFANFNSATDWDLKDYAGREIFDYRDFSELMQRLLGVLEEREGHSPADEQGA